MRRALALIAAAVAFASCGTETEGYPVPPPEQGMPEGTPRERNLADSVEDQVPTTNRNLGIQQPQGAEERVYRGGPGVESSARDAGRIPPGGDVDLEDAP